jgi:hypothetical protein
VPRPATTLSDAYAARLRTFERARRKLERLLTEGQVTRNDVSLFYEGILLRTVTGFEGLMEELFVGLLAGGIIPGRNVYPRATFSSHLVAREVMLGGRAFVDWLPYHHTNKRAAAFFRAGFPFTNLEKADVKLLEKIILVRNAVAHQSRAARHKFEDEVIGTTPVLPIERTPAGYLRSVFRVAPAQTRYEEIASTCAILANKLCL